MKKLIILFLASILFSLNAHSQITKGNWMVGGDGSFSLDYTRYEYNEIAPSHGFRGSISPGVGYFLTDKLALGLKADFNVNRFHNGSAVETQYSLGTGPFLRYYFLPAENIINIFGGVAYEHNFRFFYASPANTYSVFAGPTFFFNSSVAAELLAELDYSKQQGNETTLSFKMNIGLQIYLKK